MNLFPNRKRIGGGKKLFIGLFVLSLLTACGGGGGNEVAPMKKTIIPPAPPPDQPPPPPPPPTIFTEISELIADAPTSKKTVPPGNVPQRPADARQYIPIRDNGRIIGGDTGALNPCLQNPLPACTRYIGYSEINRGLSRLAAANADVAAVFPIGETFEKRTIMAIKISDNPRVDENEATVLIIGGYHAREWLAINFVYLLVEYLLANKNTPAIKWHLDNSEVWIVPLLNADGREYDGQSVRPGKLQRKNRRPIKDALGNTVAFGVDLNRNHNYLWGTPPQSVVNRWNRRETLRGNVVASDDITHNTYRGPAAHSELETRAICRLAHKISPDVGVSYHTYSQLFLHPWGYTDGGGGAPGEVYHAVAQVAKDASEHVFNVHGVRYTPQPGAALYNTNGDFGDWMFGVLGAWAYTPELRPARGSSANPRALFYPPENQIQPAFEENIPAALHFIRAAIVNDHATKPLLALAQDCGISP